jgi:arylsulfatase A-like enzyme
MRTLAEEMKDAGYATGAFGKWGLGFVGTEGDPLKQGFDRFYGYNCQRESHRYYPDHLWDDNRKVMLEGNGGRLKKTTFAPDLIQQQALAFMDEHKSKPFFLFLPYVLPHAELDGPEDSLFLKFKARFPERAYKGADYGPGASVAGYGSQEYPRAMFASMVSRLDRYVGQVMDKLRQLGLDRNTLVIFTSDNGPHQEGGADPAFFNSSGGLRGTKRDLYEGGIRVPMIARWPSAIGKGKTSNHPSAFWDIYPTLAGVAGRKPVQPTDGISVLPSLTGKGRQLTHGYLYWEFHESGGVQAVRAGKWKAVKRNVRKGDNPLELYDLSADPAETKDLAAGNPTLVKRLQEIMNTAHVESPVFPLNPVK